MAASQTPRIVVLISATTEWLVTRIMFFDVERYTSPLGEWFELEIDIADTSEKVVFFHGGWGKIAAAASTQYVIDHWSPSLLINLGTCGGFAGEIEKGAIILAEQTVVYDIVEQIGDQTTAITHYSTKLDLSWLGDAHPFPVQRTLLISADRDLVMKEIPDLKTTYGAVAGDWESGAIAYIATRNNVRCLILRGVSDVVSETHGEAYDNYALFVESATGIMQQLITSLPEWLAIISWT
ncbi:MAG: hypothetical protein ABI406_08305 [Ktedonobacteraceae bacterium]